MDNETRRIRRLIALAIAAFVVVAGLLTLIVFYVNRDRSAPLEKTTLPKTQEVAAEGVYGVSVLNASSLSQIQIVHIEEQLNAFIKSGTVSSLTTLTVQPETISTSATSDGSSKLSFLVVSNTKQVFRVEGVYVSTNDIYVTVYPENNTDPLYTEPYDVDDD